MYVSKAHLGTIDECDYRSLPSERPPPCLSAPPPSFIRPPPLFFHIERIGIMNAPPLVYPPPPFSEHPPSRYLASDSPTMPNEVPKDISEARGTWPTIVSAFTMLMA